MQPGAEPPPLPPSRPERSNELPPFWQWGGLTLFPAKQRKWIAVAGTGCGLIALGVVAIVLGVGWFALFGPLTKTEVYRTAVARAKSNPAVIAALGDPVREGWLLSGGITADGSSETADFGVPISGPRGKGRIDVIARKSAGQWIYSKLTVEVEKTGETIDLGP